MVILGIDPGLASTGYGAIACSSAIPSLQRCGAIKTSPSDQIPRRLFQIHDDLSRILEALRPDIVAVENVFSMARYPRAAIMLGAVVGVVHLTVFKHHARLIEVMPKEVKNALAASGSATKIQIRHATSKILRIEGLKSFHAADALAIALTVFYRNYRGNHDIVSGRKAEKDLRR
jgi:crossover junction endodeoxyribonuclease RuvC